jgi:hypothetical protein
LLLVLLLLCGLAAEVGLSGPAALAGALISQVQQGLLALLQQQVQQKGACV